VAVSAGRRTLELITPDIYKGLEGRAAKIIECLEEEASRAGLKILVNRVGSLFSPFFEVDHVRNFEEAKKASSAVYGQFFHFMKRNGVLIPPSPFEIWFLSTAHDDGIIDETLTAIQETFKSLER